MIMKTGWHGATATNPRVGQKTSKTRIRRKWWPKPKIRFCTAHRVVCFRPEGFIRENPTSLKSDKKATTFDCSVTVNSIQPESLQAWLAEISKPVQSDWEAHCAYWKSFWNRSYINIISGGEGKFNLDQCRFTQFAQGSKAYEGHKEIDAAQNVDQINQRYALERFCQAAASRGAVPPPYNGSIFTMDMPAGVLGFDKPKENPVSPDGRDWADAFVYVAKHASPVLVDGRPG